MYFRLVKAVNRKGELSTIALRPQANNAVLKIKSNSAKCDGKAVPIIVSCGFL